jgi:hypothetical protein
MNGWSASEKPNISFKMLSRELSKSNIQTVLYGYDLKDVFNCDETGLFWHGYKGGKLTKERLTIMLTVLAVGEKLKPFVIVKAKMPRSFNKKLPHTITWRSNSKACMLTSLMEEYKKKSQQLDARIQSNHFAASG